MGTGGSAVGPRRAAVGGGVDVAATTTAASLVPSEDEVIERQVREPPAVWSVQV